MKIAILGRTHMLLAAAQRLRNAGHAIVLVGTAQPAEFYSAGINEFQDFATLCNCPFFCGSLEEPSTMALVAQSAADIAISMNWPTILGEASLAMFPQGIVNVHAGDLPRYRGNACPNWAILNGEPHVGLCAHFMAPGSLDSGPVLVRTHFPLTEDTYIGDVYAWLEEAIPDVLASAVDGLATGRLAPEPQPTDPALELRCFPRRPEDSRIDWRAPADQILRLIRASSEPFAGAFAFYEGRERINIWKAVRYACQGKICAMPGQVMVRLTDGVAVACGDGAISIQRASFADGGDALPTISRQLRGRLT